MVTYSSVKWIRYLSTQPTDNAECLKKVVQLYLGKTCNSHIYCWRFTYAFTHTKTISATFLVRLYSFSTVLLVLANTVLPVSQTFSHPFLACWSISEIPQSECKLLATQNPELRILQFNVVLCQIIIETHLSGQDAVLIAFQFLVIGFQSSWAVLKFSMKEKTINSHCISYKISKGICKHTNRRVTPLCPVLP